MPTSLPINMHKIISMLGKCLMGANFHEVPTRTTLKEIGVWHLAFAQKLSFYKAQVG